MKRNIMDRLIGKYCKFVVHEESKKRAHIIFGMLEDIDYDAGVVIIKSNPSLLSVDIENIVAIKPKV